MSLFSPSRDAALTQLHDFLPNAGAKYASYRNFDHGPDNRANVSVLSPYIRHRLVLESEVIAAILQRHSFNAASKFIQEVCWRTYWKGWLETRPGVWIHYNSRLDVLRHELSENTDLRMRYQAAIAGRTGIDCFDAWARELTTIGYVHNHARMWFASLWIYTLRLPWELGADFFFRSLYDGDPASNTLSWRWVAGLHTKGKTYLARADNIATYTGGRFRPRADEWAPRAEPLAEDETFNRVPLRAVNTLPVSDVTLLVTEEDCYPESLPLGDERVTSVAWLDPALYYADDHSAAVVAFKTAAVHDAATRAASRFKCNITPYVPGQNAITVTAFAPVGPLRDYLANETHASTAILYGCRDWDTLFWPNASGGFFKLKERIPIVFRQLGLG